jgi:prepilin-type N-terminal cleavage/methylation domain-containing protein
MTLLELLAVVVILGILAAVAVPRLASSTVGSARGEAGATGVADTLRLARRQAVEHGATNAAGYSVVCTATSYSIKDLSAGTLGPSTSLPQGWAFESSSYTVTFDPYGAASGTGGVTSLSLTDGTRHWHVNFVPATGFVSCTGG